MERTHPEKPFLAERLLTWTAAFLLVLVVSALAAATASAAGRTSNEAAACVTRQELTARSAGIIQKFYASEGQDIKRGDLILEFDSRQVRAGLKEAQGAFDAAKANEDLAADALARLEKLKSSEAVSDQQMFEGKIHLAQAKAVRRQAEGAVDRVRAMLEDTVIKAEIDGVVRGLPTTLGMAVQQGQSLGRIESKGDGGVNVETGKRCANPGRSKTN